MRYKSLPPLFIGNKAVTRIRLLHMEFIHIFIRNLLNYLLTRPYFFFKQEILVSIAEDYT